MIEPSARRPGAELLDVHRLRLVESAAPRLTPEERLAMDRVWDELVRANPSFFDGPVLVCAGTRREGPYGLAVSWGPDDLPALRPPPRPVVHLVAAVLLRLRPPTGRRRTAVGRPHVQLHGGPGPLAAARRIARTPEGDRPLDMRALHRHAARELIEETGIEARPEDLTFWNVTRAGNGSIGVLFRAPSRPAAHPARAVRGDGGRGDGTGREPELNRIALIGSTAQLPDLAGPHADYLEPIVRRYAEGGGTGVLDMRHPRG